MNKEGPLSFIKLPLSVNDARKIINEIALNYSSRVMLSKHAKLRMSQRNINLRQILSLLRSRSCTFTEGPFQEINGSWKFNIQGLVAGETISVTVVLKQLVSNPVVLIVTVWGVS